MRGTIIGYRNICPHMGIELDWEPARLMTKAGDVLRCTRGPCQGESLLPVALRIQDGGVMLDG